MKLGLLLLPFLLLATLASARTPPPAAPIEVIDILPPNIVTDGSVSFQAQLQAAIDASAATAGALHFAPMIYGIDDPAGLKLHSNLTLRMEGATFLFSAQCRTDGQLFHGQGLIALYHVHDFTIRGCRFEDSCSDGTHFFFCERGHFTDNRVYRAMMGGYFLESCQHVLAANNIIRDNGSRGVTIERGSEFCTLTGNTIETDLHQAAAIRVDTRTETRDILIEDNLFIGENRRILIEGSGQTAVTTEANSGAEVERVTGEP